MRTGHRRRPRCRWACRSGSPSSCRCISRWCINLSATESGIALIPIALTTPGSLLSGQAMLYWKHYKRAPVIGLVLRAGRARVPDLAARPAARLRDRAAGGGRHRGRPRLSGHHGVDPERGAAPSGRHRHGRAELLPLARLGLHGRGDGRDPARRARRRAGARRPRGLGDRDGQRAPAIDVAFVFRWVFLAAFVFLALEPAVR